MTNLRKIKDWITQFRKGGFEQQFRSFLRKSNMHYEDEAIKLTCQKANEIIKFKFGINPDKKNIPDKLFFETVRLTLLRSSLELASNRLDIPINLFIENLYPEKIFGYYFVNTYLLTNKDGILESFWVWTFNDGKLSQTINGKHYISEYLVLNYKTIEELINRGLENYLPESDRKESKTYLLFNSHSGLYKIGKSINPAQRLKSIQNMTPGTELLMFCNSDIESELHEKYKERRHSGEWFELSENELEELVDKFSSIGGKFFNVKGGINENFS